MYRVYYWQGNGYGCSCCGHSVKRYEEYKTYEKALEFMAEIEAIDNYELEDWENESDRQFCELLFSKVVDPKTFPDLNEMISAIKEERRKKVASEKAVQDAKEAEAFEKRELNNFKRLKIKYDGGVAELA